jgi:hypothetical protein
VGRDEFGEPVYYPILDTADRRSVWLDFCQPSQGYYTKEVHHYLFKLFLHAYNALCRLKLLRCD